MLSGQQKLPRYRIKVTNKPMSKNKHPVEEGDNYWTMGAGPGGYHPPRYRPHHSDAHNSDHSGEHPSENGLTVRDTVNSKGQITEVRIEIPSYGTFRFGLDRSHKVVLSSTEGCDSNHPLFARYENRAKKIAEYHFGQAEKAKKSGSSNS